MNLKEILEEFVEKDYDELMDIFRISYLSFLKTLEKDYHFPTNMANTYAIDLIAASIAADGELAENEITFLKDTFSLKDDQIQKLFDRGKKPYVVNGIEHMLMILSTDVKEYAITLCLSIIAIDEKITREEVAFIERLLY
jgi:hypothetical protein